MTSNDKNSNTSETPPQGATGNAPSPTTGKKTQLALSSKVRLARPGDPIFSRGFVVGETMSTGSQPGTPNPSPAPADPMRPAIDAVEAFAQERATETLKNTPSK